MQASPEATADAYIRGRTTEAILRDLAASPKLAPSHVIAALVRRYDRKAEKRAERASDGIAVGQPA